MAFFGIGGANFEFIRHVFLSAVTERAASCVQVVQMVVQVVLGVIYTTYYADYQHNYSQKCRVQTVLQNIKCVYTRELKCTKLNACSCTTRQGDATTQTPVAHHNTWQIAANFDARANHI